MNGNPAYYSIMTAEIRYDKNLSDFDKVLASDITALCNKYGYCTASNHYFAQVFNKSKDTISKRINNLIKNGYYRSVLIYKKGTKEVMERRLYPSTKTSIPLDENVYTPLDENDEDNNTSINITSIKNKQKEKTEDEDLPENINLEAFNQWCQYKGKNYSRQGKTLSANKLSKFTHKEQREMVNNSIMNNYKGLFEVKNKSYDTAKAPEVGSIAWRMQQQNNSQDAIDAEVEECTK